MEKHEKLVAGKLAIINNKEIFRIKDIDEKGRVYYETLKFETWANEKDVKMYDHKNTTHKKIYRNTFY